MGHSEDPPCRVLIIGAGAGGVATAARLAQSGLQVTVVEKNDFTGGRCSLIHKNGYRFDQGPSLLLLPDMFRETFRDLGTTMQEEGITLVKCEPNYKVHFHDGTSFTLSTDISIMKSEIEAVEGKGGFERYLSFLQESHRHYELSVIHVLRKSFHSFLSMMRPRFLPHLFELHIFESVYSRASKYFRTERLRRVFTFASMYMGMSPFDAPGTYSLLQYTELAEGIWYPKGGFHRIVQALVEIGKRSGVTYRMNSPISRIILSEDSNRALGVVLQETGEELMADIVICNADLTYAYNHLLSPTSYSRSIAKKETSCSSISFYWGLDKQFPQLKAHNIFLAENYKESFDSIFKKHQIPDEPSFYVNVPSRVDSKAAPEGCDALVVLVPVGHLVDSSSVQDWDAMVSAARVTVLHTIEMRLKICIGPHIATEFVNTPPSWKAAFNLDRGAILGLSHSFFNVLSFRPKTRHSKVRNLHFVGASTHPGTGVPIVLAGAKMVSEDVLTRRKLQAPWYRRNKETVVKVGSLDKLQLSPVWDSVWWVLLLLLTLLMLRSGVGF